MEAVRFLESQRREAEAEAAEEEARKAAARECTEYKVNLAAATDGECVCGRPKADHTVAALTPQRRISLRRSSLPSPVAAATDSPTTTPASPPATTRARPKAASLSMPVSTPVSTPISTPCRSSLGGVHRSPQERSAEGARPSLQGPRLPLPAKVAPAVGSVGAGLVAACECPQYKINLTADIDGECVCGWPKAAHSEAALTTPARRSRGASESLGARFPRVASS